MISILIIKIGIVIAFLGILGEYVDSWFGADFLESALVILILGFVLHFANI